MKKFIKSTKCLSLLLVVCLVMIVGTVAWAASSYTYHGTIEVVPSGGGGGGGGTPITYDFKVTSDPEGEKILTDSDLDLGKWYRGETGTKTVYLTKTGTASSVTVAIDVESYGTGLKISKPEDQTLTSNSTAIPVDISFEIDSQAPFDTKSFDITFSLASST